LALIREFTKLAVDEAGGFCQFLREVDQDDVHLGSNLSFILLAVIGLVVAVMAFVVYYTKKRWKSFSLFF